VNSQAYIDQLFEAKAPPGLRLKLVVRAGFRESCTFPAVVSRETVPFNKKFGNWRVTLFDEDGRTGLRHYNFNSRKPPTLEQIQSQFDYDNDVEGDGIEEWLTDQIGIGHVLGDTWEVA
jgi:hypothetical protein